MGSYRLVMSDELSHHGILGQKWGVRRWQYADGRYNEAGKERYFGSKNHRQSSIPSETGGGLFSKSKNDPVSKKMSEMSPSGKETKRQAMDTVNPKNIRNKKERRMNCGNSVLAYEMRLRGEDVMARNNTKGLTIPSAKKMFDNLDEKSVLTPKIDVSELLIADLYSSKKMAERSKRVQESISKDIIDAYPDDARGCCFVPTVFGSHWISWEKQGNDVTFLNPQNPNIDLDKSFFGNYMYFDNPLIQTTTIRTDNAKFSSSIDSLVTSAKNPDLKEVYDTYLDIPQQYRPKR